MCLLCRQRQVAEVGISFTAYGFLVERIPSDVNLCNVLQVPAKTGCQCARCCTLDKDFVEKIQNTKGSRGESKEGVINAELNPYWDEFLKNDGKVESAA